MTAKEFLIEKGILSIKYQIDINIVQIWLDQYAEQFKKKSEQWDKLGEEIAKLYIDENGDELSEDETEDIDLGTIGEIAASSFGWL